MRRVTFGKDEDIFVSGLKGRPAQAILLSSGAITEEEADQRRHARRQEILKTVPAFEAQPPEEPPSRRPSFGRPEDVQRRRPSLVGP